MRDSPKTAWVPVCAPQGWMLRCPSGIVHGCSHGPRAQGVTRGACPQVSVYTCHEPWSAPGVSALTFRPDLWAARHQVSGGVQSCPFPQNDLPASTPASKSCDSSPPQDASTPGPSSASHLRQLAAKPAPSTDSIGESLLPAGELLTMGVGRQEVWLTALALPCTFHDSELDTASCWASCFFIVLA